MMLDKLKKHSVKIFVFTINILLAAIAVLIIREKDQARLLENVPKEVPTAGGNAQNISLPSFQGSVSAEDLGNDSSQTNVSESSPSVDNSVIVPPAPSPAPVPAPKSVAAPAPAAKAPTNPALNIAAPTPVPTAKPSNAKTKTS